MIVLKHRQNYLYFYVFSIVTVSRRLIKSSKKNLLWTLSWTGMTEVEMKEAENTLSVRIKEKKYYAHSFDAKDCEIIDSRDAMRRKWRVRESVICLFTFSGGTDERLPGTHIYPADGKKSRLPEHPPPHFRPDAKNNRVPACILRVIDHPKRPANPDDHSPSARHPSSRRLYSL